MGGKVGRRVGTPHTLWPSATEAVLSLVPLWKLANGIIPRRSPHVLRHWLTCARTALLPNPATLPHRHLGAATPPDATQPTPKLAVQTRWISSGASHCSDEARMGKATPNPTKTCIWPHPGRGRGSRGGNTLSPRGRRGPSCGGTMQRAPFFSFTCGCDCDSCSISPPNTAEIPRRRAEAGRHRASGVEK